MDQVEEQLRRKLSEQLQFIEASCTGFDEGRRIEGYRIATHLRILFHHRPPSSRALMHQLGKPDVLVLSTRIGPPPAFAAFMARFNVKNQLPENALVMVRMEASTVKLLAPLGNLPMPPRSIPLSEWLAEIVFTSAEHKITRYQLFKAAANKDGGAHVDIETLPHAYQAHAAPGSAGTAQINGRDFPLEDAHLVTLRQMGYEVLNSPDIRALEGRGKR